MDIDNLSLVEYNDTGLHKPCEPWNFLNPPFDIYQFSVNMVDLMRKSNGIGLSANQVGVPYKIFVMESEPVYIVINPIILDVSDELINLEEGCLSYPGLITKVKRPLWVKAKFNYPNGQAKVHRFEGITARCFLHEYDHIEFGETMIDNTHPIHRDKIKKEWKKILAKRNR